MSKIGIALGLALVVWGCARPPAATVPADSATRCAHQEVPTSDSAAADEEPSSKLVETLNLGFERGVDGWFANGAEPDGEVARFGKASVRMTNDGTGNGFAVITGRLPLADARGRRVRFTGWIKTDEVVDGYAGLWLRVDKDNQRILLDNMDGRGVTGTSDWQKVEIVADVSSDATTVLIGALMPGKGTAWVDGLDVAFEDVEQTDTLRVAGRVESPGGDPIAGAVVAFVAPNGFDPAAVVESNANGAFEAAVPPGEYAVTATASGWAGAFVAPTQVSSDTGIAVRMTPAADSFSVTGKVADPDGNGLAGEHVLCFRQSEYNGDIFVTLTRDDGTFAMALTHAPYLCAARGKGGESRYERVERATQGIAFTLALPGVAPDAVVDWIRERAVPLLSVESGHGFRDMRPLAKMIGGARVVGLGEATHGTREFFQMKHRMLEYLVSELGFTVFAIEANWPESEAVNDYVLTGKGDPAKALAGMHFWTWDTEEVRDLIEWMRQWNANPRHKRKVKFYGFDMQFAPAAVAALTEYLEQVEPALAAEARQAFEPFGTEDYGELRKRVVANQEALIAALSRFGKHLDDHRKDYVERLGKRRWLIARHSVRLLEQNVELNTARDFGLDIRDRSMAENLRWIADVAEPGAKIVAWAHNGHVATDDNAVRWMGHHLEEALGKDYVPVGFAFHRGSFQAMDVTPGGDKSLKEFTIGAPPAGSVGDTFERAGWPVFVLDLRALPASGEVGNWFRRPQQMRSIGSAFSSEEAMTASVELAKIYELIIFVEATTRARPNPTGLRPPK